MALQHLAIKFRPKDRDLNIVLNDIRFVVNQLVDIASSGTMTDYLVKVGASGTADYLSSDYFSRSAAGHIIIKNAYTAGTGIAGGGDLSAARTFSLSHLGIESLTDPGADRIFFWDDGESASKWLSPNTALEISTTNLNVKYDNVTIKVDGSNQLYAAIGAAESDPVFSAWIAGPPDVSEFTNDVGYLTSVTAHNLLSATHGDTTVGTVVRGDIITGQGATPKWVRLAKGTTGYFLKADATDAVWAAHGLTYSDVGALASGGTAVDSDKWDSYQFADYLDQAVKQASAPRFAKLGINTASIVERLVEIGGTFDIGANGVIGIATNNLILSPGDTTNAWFTVFGGTVYIPAGETCANAYGMSIGAVVKTGTGTITKAYGLYVDTPTAASTNVCGYLAGPVGIGTISPGAKLESYTAAIEWAMIANGVGGYGLQAVGSTYAGYFIGPVYGTGDCSMLSFTDRP